MSVEQHKTVHVGAAWRVLLRDLGLDERVVLRRAGQPPTLFDGDGTHISLDDYYALHEAVEAEADDPALPLKGGQIVSVELFDPALFAAICSPGWGSSSGWSVPSPSTWTSGRTRPASPFAASIGQTSP